MTICSVLVALFVVCGTTGLFAEMRGSLRYLAGLIFSRNFHTVIARRFYRSGEMQTGELARHIERYGIQSVIDLRLSTGVGATDSEHEAKLCEEKGVSYRRVPLNGARVPSMLQVQQLFSAFDAARIPVLVHCSSGTHRAGFASSVWLMDKEGIRPEHALAQFSPQFGYFALERLLKAKFSGHSAIDRGLRWYASEWTMRGLSFREWIEELDHGFSRWLSGETAVFGKDNSSQPWIIFPLASHNMCDYTAN